MRILLSLVILAASCASCQKEVPGESVEIYLLKSSGTIPGRCQIDPNASAIADTPTVSNGDILEYAQASSTFTLSEAAFRKVNGFWDKTPFAVAVDKRVVYFGFFKPGYSSSSCGHSITMDISGITDRKITLRLGYPGLMDGVTIDDKRNDPGLLAVLEKQGKLRP